MPVMITLVDNTIPVASDFNTNYTNLNSAIGSGTAITAYVTGDIPYASAANTLSRLAIGSTNRPLVVVGGIPAWGTGQISFPATQSASADANTLDDFEESTWTPVITFATPGNLSVAYSTQIGRYQKIGRLVNAYFTLITSTFTHTTASGALQITGLPFTSVTSAGIYMCGPLLWQGITKANYTSAVLQVISNVALAAIILSGSGQAAAEVTTAEAPTGGTLILAGQATYEASA